MNVRKLRSKAEIVKFGYRDLTAEALTGDELIKFDKEHEADADERLHVLNSMDEINMRFFSLPTTSTLFQPPKLFSDGAELSILGSSIRKEFYQDHTNNNPIFTIDISITDTKKLPQCAPIHINVVLKNVELADKFNKIFNAEKLDLVPTGKQACAFANYAALKSAFDIFIDHKIISAGNAKIILDDIELFMQGRNLLPTSPTLKTKTGL